jgi:50S ribosomal protein L16 3-hydroxylase
MSDLLGMPVAQFLRRYWQKRPLLVRQALPGFRSPIAPEDLAGLACEELAHARLVTHQPRTDRWTLRSGPLAESDFSTLKKSHWTLLVQDVDKWDDSVAALLDHFDFIPDWRLDDIMISYAVDQGSVGPHVDNYDVFLLQGMGKRRWLISDDPTAPQDFRNDSDLKLLKQFTPTHDWVLEPGDMLYLPPGFAHHGIAQGPCMTYSIGLRAPSAAEMLLDFAETLAEQLTEDRRFADPDLTPPAHGAEIDANALARVEQALAIAGKASPAQRRQWFGTFITRYRAAQTPAPRPRKITLAALRAALLKSKPVRRNPWTRLAYARDDRSGAELYAAGNTYTCGIKLAQFLCSARRLPTAPLARLDSAELELLRTLINDGHFGIDP